MTDRLLTECEAAKFLTIPAATLHYWRTRRVRRGPRFVKIHRRAVRYRVRDLRVFLEIHTIRPKIKERR